jgi:hypothetical protein
LKDIAIVICNFNKRDYLKDSLLSIINADFKAYSRDIIVVDNASNDGSCKMLQDDFKEVILIQTGANLGGAGGFAAGMQYALDKGYAYVTVLDNDTKVEPNVFTKLLKQLQNDLSLGVAGATILQMDFPTKVQEMGAHVDYENYLLSLNYTNFDIADKELPDELECDYVPACCFMTKLEVLQKVGVFDKDYFIYFDDVDWNTRAKKVGYKIKAFKDVHVWHKGGARLLTNTFAQYYSYRNMIRYFLKYLDNTKFEHFSSSFCEHIQKAIFFSNLKNEFNSAKSILLAIDDAYTKRVGARFDAVFPKENQINKFYKLCSEKKNILIMNHATPNSLEKIIHNISAISSAKIICSNNLAKMPLESYDLVAYAVDHILEYTQFQSLDIIVVDSYGNYIIDADDAVKLSTYKQFDLFFKQTLQPVLKHKFLQIFQTSQKNDDQCQL